MISIPILTRINYVSLRRSLGLVWVILEKKGRGLLPLWCVSLGLVVPIFKLSLFARRPLMTLVPLLLLLLHVGGGDALRIEGSLDTLTPWSFAERFCFVPTKGTNRKKYGVLEFEVKHKSGGQLLLYHDGFEKWREIYESSMACWERREKATTVIELGMEGQSFVESVEKNGDLTTTTKGSAYFEANENLWLFIVLGNCQAECPGNRGCQGPLEMEYAFHLTNGKDARRREFSADEIGTLETMSIFLGLYLILSFLSYFLLRRRLLAKKKYHTTVALLCWSIYVQLLGCLCGIVHFGIYAGDGWGSPQARNAGIFLGHLADILLVLVLILLAKGWTIVRRSLSINGRVKIAVYITTLLWTTLALELWRLYVYDKARSAYYYESAPGTALVALRGAALVWFRYAVRTTALQYPRKKRFYLKFTMAFTLWLLAKPLLVIIAAFFIPDNQRFLIVLIAELSLAFSAHVGLAFLYCPDLPFNNSFPFHRNADDMASGGDILGALVDFFTGFGIDDSRVQYDTTRQQRQLSSVGVDIDTGHPLDDDDEVASNVVVSRRTVFRRISIAGGKTARLMRTMGTISKDLDSALLDLQGEVECDVDA